MKNPKILAVGAALALAVSVGATNSQETSEGKGWTVAGVYIANPIDASTWWEGGSEMNTEATVAINPVDPEFWVGFINPESHGAKHASFLNPKTYEQFFETETYMAMADVDVLKKWVKADTFAPVVDPQTYAFWAQPGAYKHLVKVERYAKLVDPAAYVSLADAALTSSALSYVSDTGKNLFGKVFN